MKFAHILHALYEEPWLISAEMHSQLCEIVKAHISGKAHAPEGRVAEFAEANGKLPELTVVAGIAVVNMVGVIGKRVGMMEKSSGVMDVDDFTEQIQIALDRDDVKGILIDINSPGGTITGVPEAADMIMEANTIKPVVAFTDTLMASAAYWMGVGAEAVVATKSASIGSIGVFSAILDSSKAFELEGLKQELFKEGKFKAMGMPGIALTDEQKKHVQDRTTMIYNWFTSSVVESRGTVGEGSMEGQTFRGQEAREMNLIDQVGDKEDAFDLLLDLISMRS